MNKRWHTEVLKEMMMDALLQGPLQTENTRITNARHYHALKEMKDSLRDIKPVQDTKLPGDVLALDIRCCLHYLAEITREITNEDQLDYIFLEVLYRQITHQPHLTPLYVTLSFTKFCLKRIW